MCGDPQLHGLKESPLYRNGGVLRLPGVVAGDLLATLECEALSAKPTGRRNVFSASEQMEGRGGNPGRAFTTAHGSTRQWGLFSAPTMIALIRQTCGVEATPAGGGSYTYYEQAGDFLSLHRDIATCDLTVLTCLKDTGVYPSGGALLVYSNHIDRSLNEARMAGKDAATPVSLACGEMVALLGGIVPHEVTPMQPGQERIVSVMCYRVSANGQSLS